MNGYNLSRNWFNFCFENPEKIKPNHSALYLFAVEHCNRLGWKEKFGLPTEMSKEAIGIKSYNTYINTLNELVEWGFIKMIERSKNQYSANIIALSKFDKALDKALDKAFIKHVTKQSESTSESICTIDKQVNKETIELINNNATLLNEKLKTWINNEKKEREFPLDLFPKTAEKTVDHEKQEIFELWINYRIEIKKKIKVKSTLDNLIDKFNKHTLQDCTAAVNSSIDNQYTGLFFNKNNHGDKQQNKQELINLSIEGSKIGY